MDKVLIVTGGSRGIGAAVARQAAAQGWVVVLSYADARGGAGQGVARDIEAAGGHAVAVQADSGTRGRRYPPVRGSRPPRPYRRAGQQCRHQRRAGAGGRPAAGRTARDARHQRDRRVPCAAEAVRRMSTARGGEGGAIVNIGSVAARLGAPSERVHYAAVQGRGDRHVARAGAGGRPRRASG